MKFDYYYGDSVEQFKFIQIPQALIKGKEFEDLPAISKLMYGLLRDRCTLSRKNGWVDDENRVYIIYQIADIKEDMGLSEKMAIKYLNDLESFGLVEKKRQGLGRPNLLYVKNFYISEEPAEDYSDNEESYGNSRTSLMGSYRPSQKGSSRASYKESSEVSAKEASDLPKMTVQELPENMGLNNTNTINPYKDKSIDSKTSSDPILADDLMRVNAFYTQHIKNQIDYDELCEEYKEYKDLVDNVVELMVSVLTSKNEFMLIAKEQRPVALVKSKFLTLKSKHISYVIDMLIKTGSKISSIRQYLLAMLYNAQSTYDAFLTAEVSHNMRNAI